MFKALTRLTALTCIAAMAMTACDDNGTAESTAANVAPTTVAEPDEVLALYDGQERYVSAAREDPNAELSALYAEHGIGPFFGSSASRAGCPRVRVPGWPPEWR